MKDFTLNLPINSVSFGNVSISILREIYRRGLHPNVFPIGQVDVSIQKSDEGFNTWLSNCINNSQKDHSRKHTAIKLWHINGSLETYSNTDSRLITFHETDSLTSSEVNVLRNQEKVYVTSTFTQKVFDFLGISSEYLPLGFDSHNFYSLKERPRMTGIISFGIAGKLEARKNHFKVLNLWAKRYGNKQQYRLNAALHNPFLKPEHSQALINQALEGKQYWNINFVPYMATNAEYNQFLQANDIFFALSGGEGRGLPEYHATALGAWTIALNAHAYKDYLNSENSILIQPNGKKPAADGIFFHSNSHFNTGNFFDFSDDDFNVACDEAEKRAATGTNIAGLDLQKLTYKNTVDVLIRDLL